jgi:hypothetical protein
MIIVTLSVSEVEKARQWSDEILATGLADTPNYTGFRTPDRFFHGYIGELALSNWFRDSGLLYHHRVVLKGRRAGSEFFLWINEERQEVEVKTSSKPSYKKLMLPEKQKLDAELYFGTRIENENPCSVSLHGFLAKWEVEKLPVKDFGWNVDTRYCEYPAMRAMDDLLPYIDRVTKITRQEAA